MFDNLNLRNKFLAAVVVPVGVLAALALWSVAASHYLLGAFALMGGAATVGDRLPDSGGGRRRERQPWPPRPPSWPRSASRPSWPT